MKIDKSLALFPILLISVCTAFAKSELDVNVVNTPDVNVANTPSVNVSTIPDVNVATLPELTISGVSGTPYYSIKNVFPGKNICYFEVPPNMYLKIAAINGLTRFGNVLDIVVQGTIQGINTESYFIPKTAGSGPNYYYDQSLMVHFVDDGDRYNSEFIGADFRVIVETDGSGDTGAGNTICSVAGELFDLP
jgi:hypothetical protein